MNNYLFAFDLNYETQGTVAIFSLLENVSEKINIFVIRDSSNKSIRLHSKIQEHKNLNKITYKFFDTDEFFHNIELAHVSKATFYRLFISDIFNESDLELIYLDADIVCTNDPTFLVDKTFEEMRNKNLTFGFLDELYRNQYDEPFKRLGMKNDKYFNAGVMFLNVYEWNKKKLTEKSLEKIAELKDKAKFWDQDILNSLVDGNYLSIDSKLNSKTSETVSQKNVKDEIFIHYSGKSKPWSVGGILEEYSYVYHNYYKQLYERNFHIVTKNRKNALIKLVKLLRLINSMTFFTNKVLVSYILSSTFSIIFKLKK